MPRPSRGLPDRLRLAVGAAALFMTTAGCVFSCEADTVPDPLTCTNAPAEAEVRELGLATGPANPAVALEDGDATYVTVDVEGRLLVSLRVLWRGPNAPACGHVELHVRHPDTGVELAGESLQLLSSPSLDRRVSGEILFVADTWPANVDVEVMAYGVALERRLQVGGLTLDDGGRSMDAGTDADLPDADLPDAGPDTPDGGSSDAGSSDAGPADAGVVDAGALDAGMMADAGASDSGPSDSGTLDAGALDAGAPDAGSVDGGPSDAGPLDGA